MGVQISFDAFKEQWLKPLHEGSQKPEEIARRFALKLFEQWRDISHVADEIVYPQDAVPTQAYDLIYFEQNEADGDSPMNETWYVVQSELAVAPSGSSGIIDSARQALAALAGASSSEVHSRLTRFREKAGPGENGDRLVLVLATVDPLPEQQKLALNEIRILGQSLFGSIFELETISVETIYLNTLEGLDAAEVARIRVPLQAKLTPSGQHLLIGAVSLMDLYEFLKRYRDQTEDLDQIYEKNIRRFLGGRRRVNRGMKETLLSEAERFGLYNNGITLVVKDFKGPEDGVYTLTDPYVVNGCQTTRTIWEVFQQKLSASGPRQAAELERWQRQVAEAVVITKIVRVGPDGEQMLQKITRYTNSQNAVSEKDFITLEDNFRRWSRELADKYNIFLEIQRGGWDSRLALQMQNPSVRQFSVWANAFDLIKTYGAGWLREPGTAFGRNAAFVPGGRLYREITESAEQPLDVDDLYAANLLNEAAILSGFGRGSRRKSRLQTRHLFFMIIIDLLRDILIRAGKPTSRKDLSRALIKLSMTQSGEVLKALIEAGVGVIDEYLTQGEEDSVFTEPALKQRFNTDLNAYLKWDRLGSPDASPRLADLMAIHKRTMGRGSPSPRELITVALQA